MDTGLGREGYSNVSQGRIDEILAVKSTDRREIFEEAAGISKYRHRKEETERKLLTTEDNLLRIGDKVSELELQLDPLRLQSEKARNYLEYKAELRGLEIAVWLENLDKLAAAAKKAEEDYTSSSFVLEQEHMALEGLYRKAEELSDALREQDAALESVREQVTALEASRPGWTGRLPLLQGNIHNNQQNADRIREELSQQEGRSSGIVSRLQTAGTGLPPLTKSSRSSVGLWRKWGQISACASMRHYRQYLGRVAASRPSGGYRRAASQIWPLEESANPPGQSRIWRISGRSGRRAARQARGPSLDTAREGPAVPVGAGSNPDQRHGRLPVRPVRAAAAPGWPPGGEICGGRPASWIPSAKAGLPGRGRRILRITNKSVPLTSCGEPTGWRYAASTARIPLFTPDRFTTAIEIALGSPSRQIVVDAGKPISKADQRGF
ncbi:MAG: hypothetical protein ACLU9S_09710 [Oscillospiraceae bacterium]